MRTPRIRKIVAGGLGLIVLACLWFYFAPVGLGGSASYVVTDGVSMEPHFHTGDLVLVRSQSSYKVGEIVAYHSRALHTVVLHRIIGREGARYIFKGDNNNFVDFEHPAPNQLIGSVWLHLPGAGATLATLRSSGLIAVLAVIGTLLLAGATFRRHRRLRRRERRAAENAGRSPGQPALDVRQPAVGVLALGAVALLPFLVLAAIAFTRPATAVVPVAVPYRQSGTLSYTANAAPGPAYPDNRAGTGDPLFTHVVNTAEVSFAYRFRSAASHSIRGRAAIYASIVSTDGWRTTFPLGSPTYFQGDRAVVSARLDLDAVLAMVRRVEETTAVSGSDTLTLVPQVSTTGTLASAPLHTSFSPPFRFSLDQLELQPAPAASGSLSGQPSASPFSASSSGSATASRSQPRYISLGVARMSVATARWISLGGLLAVLIATTAMLALARLRDRDMPAGARSRYRHLLVPVARVGQSPGAAVIEVTDMDALARIAEHYDRSILYESSAEGDSFWVTDESGQFRYAPLGPTGMAGDGVGVPDATGSFRPTGYLEELGPGGPIAAYETQPAADTATYAASGSGSADPAAEPFSQPAPAVEPEQRPSPVQASGGWRAPAAESYSWTEDAAGAIARTEEEWPAGYGDGAEVAAAPAGARAAGPR